MVQAVTTITTSPVLTTKVKNSLNFLLRRIRRNPEFPAISQHITEITSKLSGDKKADADGISNAILKDYALTHKILRLVNSASYGNYGGDISTISRAVVILGFEKIRAIALSVILFDSLGKKKQVNTLKDSVCCSFLSAVIAKKLAKNINNIDAENAFISSMFNNLGEFLTIHYFPKEHSQILASLRENSSNPSHTVRTILGASYSELGTAIAEEWRLPESLISSMQEPEEIISKPDSLNKATSHLSSFSNELSTIAGSDQTEPNKQLAIEKLSSHYQKSIPSTPDYLQQTLLNSLNELTEFSNAIGINVTSSTFYHQLTTKIDHPPEQHETEIVPDEKNTVANRQLTLVKGIADISQAMLSDFELSDIINMIIETVYRGMNFDNVIFCLRNNPKKLMQARFGLGEDIQDILPKFSFKIINTKDIFNLSINRKKEFVILDTNSSNYKNQIPEWCRELTNPSSITLFPVIINNICIGIIYADNTKKTLMTAEQIQLFSALRNQAAMAIQLKKGKR